MSQIACEIIKCLFYYRVGWQNKAQWLSGRALDSRQSVAGLSLTSVTALSP